MQGAGGLIGETRGGASKYYHADALGTTRAITNSSQTKTDSLDTDAFGMSVAVTGSTPTPFGFAGQHGYQNDSVTGLMRLGHRYYDASVGRFLSRDPIQDGYNWYTYVGNDPVNGVDPEGLTEKGGWFWGFGAGQVCNQNDPSIPICFDFQGKVVRIKLPKGYETDPLVVDVDFVKIGPNRWIHITPTINGTLYVRDGQVHGHWYPGTVPDDPNYPGFPSNMGIGNGKTQRPPKDMTIDEAIKKHIVRPVK